MYDALYVTWRHSLCWKIIKIHLTCVFNLKRKGSNTCCFLSHAQILLKYSFYFQAIILYPMFPKFIMKIKNSFSFISVFFLFVIVWKESKKRTIFALKYEMSNHDISKNLSSKLKLKIKTLFCFKMSMTNWIAGTVNR